MASDIFLLANWFVTVIMGHQQFSANIHGRFLREAKCFLKPGPDPHTGKEQQEFTLEEMQTALRTAKEYLGQLNSIFQVNWRYLSGPHKGRTFLEVATELSEMPPLYDPEQVRAWLLQYGKRAVEKGVLSEEDAKRLLEKTYSEAPIYGRTPSTKSQC